MAHLLRSLVPARRARVEALETPVEWLDKPKGSPVVSTWTIWRGYPSDGEPKVFRIAQWCECEQPPEQSALAQRFGGVPDLLLIDDSGLGFRTSEGTWPAALAGEPGAKGPAQLVLKLAQFAGQPASPLLTRIADLGLAERTTILTYINDLRGCAVRIGVSLSWERLLEEVVAAVRSQPPFVADSGRLAYQRVIVTVGASGAIIVEPEESVLVFDRTGQEGDFAQRLGGEIIGTNTCVAAALAAAWVEARHRTDWAQATLEGVALARLLHRRGYAVVHDHLEFPSSLLARAYRGRHNQQRARRPGVQLLTEELGTFTDRHQLACNAGRTGRWTILAESVLPSSAGAVASKQVARERVYERARQIALRGPVTSLPDVPVETVGSWRSADRLEIEGVRSVKNAIQEYLGWKQEDTPLSIAVFGPPGSGKSFVVGEIAKGLGIAEDAQLTFNLSQLDSADQLAAAFHQIRDLRLSGKIPLVFWDEFDAACGDQPLGWLRHFLAPMQDGVFQEHGFTHPVGKAIYVFAGATRHSFREFCADASRGEIAVKKPDFISRLRAYIDIRGPNGAPNLLEDELCVIRRAFLLHSILESQAGQLKGASGLRIEPGVLDAFLHIPSYRHGTRSIVTLVKMSALSGKRRFGLSSLPPEHMLRMHVNGSMFGTLACSGRKSLLRVGIIGHQALAPRCREDLERGVREAVEFVVARYPGQHLVGLCPLIAESDWILAGSIIRSGATALLSVVPAGRTAPLLDGSAGRHGPRDRHRRRQWRSLHYWTSDPAVEPVRMHPSVAPDDEWHRALELVVEHCDVLVAVWNGRYTGELGAAVAKAEAMNKPICHLSAEGCEDQPEEREAEGQREHRLVGHRGFAGAEDEWSRQD